jgi:hypothetical protein
MLPSAPRPHTPAAAARGLMRAGIRHAAVLVLFALLAVLLTWPLAARLGTHVPGTALDDNALFMWNFWWVRQALADPGARVFFTHALFAPSGVDLVLHSYSLLNAFAGATLLGGWPLPSALGLTLLAACALNGFITYLVAMYLTGHRTASLAAGMFFAACPVFTVHLFGHFNYYTAWPLVAFVGVWLWAVAHPSWRASLPAGASLALVAYADYYYFVYALVFALLALAGTASAIDLVPRASRRTRVDRMLIAFALLAIGASLVITMSGGGVWQVGAIRISLKTGTNVRAVATALALWWLWRRRTWRISMRWRDTDWRRYARMLAGAAAACALLMAPILSYAWTLWRAGQYVTQSYWWKSAPSGIDLAGLVSGNPFNPFWGAPVRALYDARGMDTFNDPLWLGIVPLVLLVTRRDWMALAAARRWLLMTMIFLVWAVGPFLTIFGVNTGLPLPQILLRYVPVVSNARIPAHAAVMVCLGTAILLAYAMSRARRLQARGPAAAVVAVILIDLLAAPFPLTPLPHPPLYERLASRPAGAVLDVPTGIRDGFGPEGVFDASVLYFQTIHRHPIATGYVARLPPSVRQRYDGSPVMRALFQLSAGEEAGQPLDPGSARAALSRDWHVRYVVVHGSANAAVRAFVEAMGLRVIDRDESRTLYAID